MRPPTILTKIRSAWHHAGFQKYLKNTSWALFGRIVSLGISFVTSIYVIRHLGPDNYGLLSFSVSFVGLFSFVSTLGIESVLYRELSKDLSKKDVLIGTALLLRVLASCVAMAMVFVAIVTTHHDPLTRLLVVMNSFTMLFSSSSVIGYLFQAKVQAKYHAIPLILVTLILSILKVLVIYFDKGVIYFAGVLCLEYVLYTIISVFLYWRLGYKIQHWTFNTDIARSLLRDSWPLMLSAAFTVIYTRIDQVMLKFITNNANVGVYDAGVKISEVWYFIPALIVSSLFPAIINSQKVSRVFFEQRIMKLYSLLFYLALCVALPVTLFADHIINVLYGSAFAGASSVLSLYVWAGIPVFLSIAISSYLIAENKTIVSFVSSIIGMVANIVLNLILIPLYGTSGAAVATLISYTLVPLSLILFTDTRGHVKLIIQGIVYPFSMIMRHL